MIDIPTADVSHLNETIQFRDNNRIIRKIVHPEGTADVFPVFPTDNPMLLEGLSRTVDRGYSMHGVEPGELHPFDIITASQTYLSHASSTTLPGQRYFGGTLTLQIGLSLSGEEMPTEMAQLLTGPENLRKNGRTWHEPTSIYDSLHTTPNELAELKRLALSMPDGSTGMGPFEGIQLIQMIQAACIDAEPFRVKKIGALLNPKFARNLIRMGLQIQDAPMITLDWLTPKNAEYFLRYKHYFLNQALLAESPAASMGEAAYINQLVAAASAGNQEALSTLNELSVPRLYFADREYLLAQTTQLLAPYQC